MNVGLIFFVFLFQGDESRETGTKIILILISRMKTYDVISLYRSNRILLLVLGQFKQPSTYEEINGIQTNVNKKKDTTQSLYEV